MEVAQVAQLPVDIVKPVVIDKQPGCQTEVTPEAVTNNHTDSNIPGESVKILVSELAPHSPAEEVRPVVEAVRSSNGETEPVSSNASEGAEVVTPAGTVEAPHYTNDTESVEKDSEAHVKKANEIETLAHAVELEPQKEEQHKVDQNGIVVSVTPSASTEPTPEAALASSPGKKAKTEKKQNCLTVRDSCDCNLLLPQNDSFASDEILSEVQKFLTLQIVENRCSSHTKEIHEFMERHLNEKQQRRYISPLLERIMQLLTQEAIAKGEEVSVDVQSNICLIEQMFLTLGRRSPLQDMYTAEEEEMLDLLFHSNSSDNLLTTL